jgi:GNAT superfamily N-acetyltransferase
MPHFPFSISLIQPSHDPSKFDCGEILLNDYLTKFALQNTQRKYSIAYVGLEQGTNTVIGYYCLSSAQISLASIPPALNKYLPRHPVPATRIGRFAVHTALQNKGVGTDLFYHSLSKIKEAATIVGSYLVIVDAKNPRAKNFYLKQKFVPFLDNPDSLIFPISKIP